MKRRTLFATLAIAILVCLTSNAFAAQSIVTDIQSNATTIPEKMPPGTRITYDQNNQMIIEKPDYNILLKEKQPRITRPTITEEEKNKLDDEEKKLLDEIEKIRPSLPVYHLPEPELPKPQPGMKVYYDGMGLPTKITVNGIPFNNETLTYTPLPPWFASNGVYNYGDCTLTITDTYVLGEGWVSWYWGVGETGADSKVLTNDDCATKMAYDIPSPGTDVRVRNLYNDIVGYVDKWDIGGLPNAVVDIMPDKMEYDFDQPIDRDLGTGRFDGRMFHYKV